MPNVLIACWGSHGDVDPYVGLGLGLQARGCVVTLATLEHYRALVTGSGLRFTPIRPNVNPLDAELMRRILDRQDGSRYVARELVYPATEAMFADLTAAAVEADLIVTHPLTPAAVVQAEYLGKPWVSTVLAPMSFFSEHELPVLAPAPWLKSLERHARWPNRWFVRTGKRLIANWPDPVYALRERLGLPRGGNPMLEGQHSPYGVLALWSTVLGAPQPDWPEKVTVTGHLFSDAAHGSHLSSELESFLDAGEPPLVFTLGSSAIQAAGTFWSASLEAVVRLGKRAVFLVGPNTKQHLSGVPQQVLVLDKAPHSLLMPRASVVVHQCGIGTLAQSLRSERPVLAVPFAHDQHDNAWRITRLGMARTLASHHYTARRAEKALSQLLNDPTYAAAAVAIAKTVRNEQGLHAACDRILSVLQANRTQPSMT